MLYPEHQPDQDPEAFKENLREAVRLFRLNADAGFPYGRSSEALRLWFVHGRTARAN